MVSLKLDSFDLTQKSILLLFMVVLHSCIFCRCILSWVKKESIYCLLNSKFFENIAKKILHWYEYAGPDFGKSPILPSKCIKMTKKSDLLIFLHGLHYFIAHFYSRKCLNLERLIHKRFCRPIWNNFVNEAFQISTFSWIKMSNKVM